MVSNVKQRHRDGIDLYRQVKCLPHTVTMEHPTSVNQVFMGGRETQETWKEHQHTISMVINNMYNFFSSGNRQ